MSVSEVERDFRIFEEMREGVSTAAAAVLCPVSATLTLYFALVTHRRNHQAHFTAKRGSDSAPRSRFRALHTALLFHPAFEKEDEGECGEFLFCACDAI